jgi:aminopeptidase Y
MVFRRSFVLVLATACLSDAISLPRLHKLGSGLQRPLGDDSAAFEYKSPVQIEDKQPEIDSKSLQNDISAAALLESAKDLFKIAELSLPDYNHPTRVIGSAGK